MLAGLVVGGLILVLAGLVLWPLIMRQKGADNSVDTRLIRRESGRVEVAGGRTLFEQGPEVPWGDSFQRGPIWPEGYVIDLWYPER